MVVKVYRVAGPPAAYNEPSMNYPRLYGMILILHRVKSARQHMSSPLQITQTTLHDTDVEAAVQICNFLAAHEEPSVSRHYLLLCRQKTGLRLRSDCLDMNTLSR